MRSERNAIMRNLLFCFEFISFGLFVNPTRLYINNDRIITNITWGIPIVGDMMEEIKTGYEMISRE